MTTGTHSDALGSFAGAVPDDQGVTWLLYVGREIERGMALQLTLVRADATHVRFLGAVWLLNLLVTSPEGYDPAAGRGSEFFERVHAQLVAAIDDTPRQVGRHVFLAPSTDTIH